MPDIWMPGASRSQDFSRAFAGSTMKPRVAVVHSTEGPSWPGYQGGATAPTVTISRTEIRQHFPVNRSARALENRAGGVETNTEGAVQIELLGYCDRKTWSDRGKKGMFWPDAEAGDLKMLVKFLRWLEAEWGVPVVDAAPRGWLEYPASYGNSRARMSGAEWVRARGIVGHQHVPENSHGDPGNFPIHIITNQQEDDMDKAQDKRLKGVEADVNALRARQDHHHKMLTTIGSRSYATVKFLQELLGRDIDVEVDVDAIATALAAKLPTGDPRDLETTKQAIREVLTEGTGA